MKYVLSVIEQGSGAAMSFALSLWLIRGNGAEAYGVYIFWFSIALVTNSLQNAMTVTHLFPLPPLPAGAQLRRSTEELVLAVTVVFCAAVGLIVAAAVFVMTRMQSTLAEPAVILFLPAFLLWQYGRALAFTRGDAVIPVLQSSLIVVLTALAGGVGWLLGVPPTAQQGLLFTGVAYAIAGVGALVWQSRTQTLDLRWSMLRRYRALIGTSSWPFLGALSVETSARLYSFIVVSWFGPAILGLMSASQVMLRPATLLTNAWTPVARAEMSNSANAGDVRGFMRALERGSVAAAGITFVWGCIVAFAWPQIDHFLYQGRFQTGGTLALMWTIQFTLTSLVLTVGVAFQALAAFRPLALAELTGAVVTGIAMPLLASHFGYMWCLGGMMFGSLVQVLAMLRVLPAAMRPVRTLGQMAG
jgi:hypothetical protein